MLRVAKIESTNAPSLDWVSEDGCSPHPTDMSSAIAVTVPNPMDFILSINDLFIRTMLHSNQSQMSYKSVENTITLKIYIPIGI